MSEQHRISKNNNRKISTPRYGNSNIVNYLNSTKTLTQIMNEDELSEKKAEIELLKGVKKSIKKKREFVPCEKCEQYAGIKSENHRRGRHDIWGCKAGIENCIYKIDKVGE